MNTTGSTSTSLASDDLPPSDDLVALWMRKPAPTPTVEVNDHVPGTLHARALEICAWLEGRGPATADDSVGTLP